MTGVMVVVGGDARGPVVALVEPLSFWGGFSAETGLITDEHHPQAGVALNGVMLVMPGGRGSSSASSVLVEAVRLSTAPAAILMQRPDEILATGSLVARELYGETVPILVLDDTTYARVSGASAASLDADGLTFS